jgi:WD40 repeat protein/AAA+ ATPase superfamily predicted ATPase
MLNKLALSKLRTIGAVVVPVVYLVRRSLFSQDAVALFALGLFILEAILLWPPARRWRVNLAAFWLTVAPLAVLGGVIRSVEDAMDLEPLVSATVFFLAGCVLTIFLVVKLTDPETWRSVLERIWRWLKHLWLWLRTKFRTLSVMYWMAILGAALIISRIDDLAGGYVFLIALVAITLTSIFKWVAGPRHRFSTEWAKIIVGIIIGIALVIVLLVPVFHHFYTLVLTAIIGDRRPTPQAISMSTVLAVLLALAAGPVAVVWGRPQGWQGRLATGVVAGGLAGAFFFGGLGIWIVGPASHLPLYILTLSRASYSVSEWALKLGAAVNAIFPATYGTFWLTVGGGAILGGLTGLLTPIRPVPAGEASDRIPIWPLVALVTAFPILELAIIANVVLLHFTEPIIQNLFDAYGFAPRWHPEWTYITAIGQTWLVLTIVQVLCLRWLHQVPSGGPLCQLAARIAFFSGLLGFAFPGFLSMLIGEKLIEESWLLAVSLITAVLGLEMLTVGWQLWRHAGSDDKPESRLPSPSTWTAAGVASGVLAAVFSHQLAVVLAVLLSQSTLMLEGLNKTPDLLLAVSVLFVTNLSVTLWLTGYLAISAHAGWALAHWHRAFQIRARVIAHQAETNIDPLRRSLPVWVVAVLSGGALALVIGLSALFPPFELLPSGLSGLIDGIVLPVAVAVGSVVLSPVGLAILFAGITLVVARRRLIERLPWPVWMLAFAVSLVGLLGLALQGPYQFPLDSLWVRLAYMFLVGPAAGLAYRVLLIHTHGRSQAVVRLTTLVGVSLLVGLLGYSSQEVEEVEGGVSRFDGQRWEVFNSDNSALGKRINYQLFEDSQGWLWFSGGSGVVIGHPGDEWQSYLPVSALSSPNMFRSRAQQLSESMYLVEGRQGRLWVALGTNFGQFAPVPRDFDYLRNPGRLRTEVERLAAASSPGFADSCVAGIAQLWDIDGKPISVLAGHTGNVTSATFSPDGTRIVTTSTDNTARVWDSSGNFLAILEGHIGDVNSATFSPDGTRIVTLSDGDAAQLWDEGNNLITLLGGHKGNITSASFSPDGTRIVTTSDGDAAPIGSTGDTAQLWDANGNQIASLNYIAPLDVYTDVTSVSLSSDGTRILAASPSAAWLWDTDGNVISVQEVSSSQKIRSVSLSPDGTQILMVINDRLVQLWHTDGNFITTLREDPFATVTSAGFSPDGTRIVTVLGNPDEASALSIPPIPGATLLWDGNGNFISDLEGHPGDVKSATFSPDGTQIVTLDKSGAARLWDGDGNFIAALAGHTNTITSISFSLDGARILTTSYDGTARLWDKDGNLIAVLNGHAGRINAASFSSDGTRIVTAECILERSYEKLELESPVTGMMLSVTGDLWLGTTGGGVLKLEGGRQLGDARWKKYSVENSSLASNDVRSIYADRAGNVWVGTPDGLSRFDGANWRTVAVPGLDADAMVTTFLEDSKGQLCMGTTHGGYWWDGQDWTSFGGVAGWPDGASVEALLEDNQRGLWAGTDAGALRFDGEEWANLLPDAHVTTFTEGPPGVIWIGEQQGLVRYDLATEEQALFNSENSGVAANWVRDLHVDPDGGLWVSTFATERTMRSPWAAISLSVLFFGYLFVNTYRGYARTPETRARRLGWKIVADPANLYPNAYTLLADTADAPAVLTRLAEYISSARDHTGAEAMVALAALSPDAQVDEVVDQIAAALEADSGRAWANSLHGLYSLLGAALAARRVSEITGLELAVNPGREAGRVSLHACSGSVEALPPFLPQGSDEAWYALERVGVALRKYQEVDAATDRLSYLADALTATEAAQTTTRSVGLPDGILLEVVASRWRAAITSEIDAISGRAELRLELRTRQIRRAEQVTLSLRLQNAGRAAAENVVVSLQPGQGLSQVGETQVTLERLSSGRSTSVEFVIAPTDVETARVVCRVTWDDRVAEGNTIEFADVVRFYEVAEEFRRILNPYIVGHPVKSAEMFYGREDIFQFIADNLRGPVQDRTLVLHGQRRSGKTSVLYQLLRGRLGQGFVPVLIDMQELAPMVRNTGDFLAETAYQLARAARKAAVLVEEPASDAFAASPARAFSRFLDALEDSLGDQRAVLMFDEFELIETKIADGKLDADLLGYFRSLMQHRDRVVFIFTGTHRLEEMSHDYWSILFNIALYRRVSFLSTADAAQLIRKPVAGALDVDELAVEKIINLTSGHPYFIQLTCWALVNHCNTQRRNYATINDVNDAVQEMLTTGEAYFAYIWQQATEDERLALTGLAHTLRPGKAWARPSEILETLAAAGDTQTQRASLVDVLDQLVAQEVLEVTREGRLRYRFQLEVLRLWIEVTKPVAVLVERGQ